MVKILHTFMIYKPHNHLLYFTVSDCHNSFNYAGDNGKITSDGVTYFNDDVKTDVAESPTNGGALADEFDTFMKPNGGRVSANKNELKSCSQIMQPLEQLHSANLALGIRLERFFESLFCSWGKFVASYPLTFIIGSIVISLYLAAGVYTNFQVTTDPVDLWVPAGSQARRDMEYFNTKFWKFYRIEQLIIEPKNVAPFVDERYLSKEDDSLITFGPVFNQTFLLEVFDLYQRIVKLSARYVDTSGFEKNVTLKDICYKPLKGECATQSIFTYFHDDLAKLHRDDYLNTIQECVEYVLFVN